MQLSSLSAIINAVLSAYSSESTQLSTIVSCTPFITDQDSFLLFGVGVKAPYDQYAAFIADAGNGLSEIRVTSANDYVDVGGYNGNFYSTVNSSTAVTPLYGNQDASMSFFTQFQQDYPRNSGSGSSQIFTLNTNSSNPIFEVELSTPTRPFVSNQMDNIFSFYIENDDQNWSLLLIEDGFTNDVDYTEISFSPCQ